MMNASTETRMSEAIRWALETSTDPSVAAADWLARDIDSQYSSAVALVTDPNIPLEHLKRAKSAFKTMRVVGETANDRRLGGRLYVAAIAAAIVRHNERITTQSDAALKRAMESLESDTTMPESLRGLAGLALCVVNQAAPTPGGP
jgi:hypothetical protein